MWLLLEIMVFQNKIKKLFWTQVLYVFGIFTENADRISTWQCPNPWSWSWVCLSIGLTPSVVCFWNFHRKCWWYQTLAIPISVAMAMAMSIFDYFGSCWSFFWRQSGLLGPRAVLKEVAYRSTWTWLMMSGRLKVKKICNAFLAKLGCFNAF